MQLIPYHAKVRMLYQLKTEPGHKFHEHPIACAMCNGWSVPQIPCEMKMVPLKQSVNDRPHWKLAQKERETMLKYNHMPLP